MSRLGMQTWKWTLCVLLSGMCVSQARPGPHYMVAIPAVLEAGAETTFCANLMEPNETVTLTATLTSAEENITLFTKTSNKDFHVCTQFQVPNKTKEIEDFKVVVRGNTFYSKEVRKVLIQSYNPATFIQTDRPLYLPGQTVNFRVVTLDSKLRPYNQTYTITIVDPKGIWIAQWRNETSEKTILQLSYSLSPGARTGQYQIIVETVDENINYSFRVEEIVWPTFDVTLEVQDEISVKQEELKSRVCAKYTYGQSVPGLVTLTACQPREDGVINADLQNDLQNAEPCYNDTKKADKSGCATFTIPMSIFDPSHKALKDVLQIIAKVVEEDTETAGRQEKKVPFTFFVGTLSIIETQSIFLKGTDVEGKVKAVDYSGKPIPDLELYLFNVYSSPPVRLQNLTTDSEGLATFSISTGTFEDDVYLLASNHSVLQCTGERTRYYSSKGHLMKKFKRDSDNVRPVSFLDVQKKKEVLKCNEEAEVQVNYTIVGEPQGTVDFLFLVLARGAIVSQGFQQFEVFEKEVNKGAVSFKFLVSPDMAPVVQVVAYAVLPGFYSVIADNGTFNTEKCFSSKVSLDFTPTEGFPRQEINMQVTALPGSLCGVNVVDRSVLIEEPGKTLNAETIFDLLPVTNVTSIPRGVIDPLPCLPVRPKRNARPHPYDSEGDPYSVFVGVGLKMATNLLIRNPDCLWFLEKNYVRGLRDDVPLPRGETKALVGLAPDSSPELSPLIITDRTIFPETWIWELVEVGDSGRKDVSVTAPDTITTWETEAFCLSPQGFGLAPRQKFTVFQPFFLELTMPYSVIRGEEFELKATIYSYLDDCMMVSMKLLNTSDDKTFEPFCLCEGERRTLNWTLPATELGNLNVTVAAEAEPSFLICKSSTADKPRIDEVTRSTIVKPEGTEMTNTYNFLRCPYGGATSDQIVLNLPADVLDLSARASVSVSGDILGRALANFDKLLKLPAGSGEQNMAGLAPIVYILHYLNATNQLSPAIREKSIDFLTKGLQTEQNYRYKNGAYSAFGSGGENTWLTAFVLRFFTTANPFIYIDPALIVESKNWLKTKQHGNGCFKMSGKLFNNRMQGGVSDEVTLTAYVTSALLSAADPADNPVIEESLRCLKDSLHDLSNTYTTALLAYVFTLAGDNETRDGLLQHLDTVAIREGDFLHWSQKSAESSASLSVETTAYVLLAKIASCPTGEEIAYGFSIFKWLMGQQNSYGGFSSTQDTVVALQALALYSTLVFSPDGSSTVTVQYPGTTLTFEVNPDNKLLYQEMPLLGLDGNIGLEVKGSACASVQIVVDYNVPTPAQTTTFSVKVKTQVDDSKPTRPKLTLKLQSLYSGQESETNLAILDITLLSGFVPDEESVKKLWGHHLVERVETSNDHVLVYLRALPKNTPINHSLDLVQVHSVKNLKSAAVKLYDYYEPRDQALTEYGF